LFLFCWFFRLWTFWHHISVVVRLVCLVELGWVRRCLSWSWSTTLQRLMVLMCSFSRSVVVVVVVIVIIIFFAPPRLLISSWHSSISLSGMFHFQFCLTWQVFKIYVWFFPHPFYFLSWQCICASSSDEKRKIFFWKRL
jgi:hypothetical protein